MKYLLTFLLFLSIQNISKSQDVACNLTSTELICQDFIQDALFDYSWESNCDISGCSYTISVGKYLGNDVIIMREECFVGLEFSYYWRIYTCEEILLEECSIGLTGTCEEGNNVYDNVTEFEIIYDCLEQELPDCSSINEVLGCTDQEANNYNSEANIDDGSCAYCCDGVENGTETGLDCGGPSCAPCNYSLDCNVAVNTISVTSIPFYINIDEILGINGACNISLDKSTLIQSYKIDCSDFGSQNFKQDSLLLYDTVSEDSCYIKYNISKSSNLCSCTNDDYPALMDLFHETDGDNWRFNSGWTSGALGTGCTPCDWYGIICDTDNRVIAINLDTNFMTGIIPSTISEIDKLVLIDLNGNTLVSEIPNEIGLLNDLQFLDIHNNQLEGQLPSSIGDLINLKRIVLINNKLTGEIPTNLTNLDNLEWLLLSNNQLTGNIPDNLEQLDNLQVLWLSTNELIGSIPSQITGISNLAELLLHENNLTGEIPENIGSLTNISKLLLNDNNLEGCFPSGLNSLCAIGVSQSAQETGYNFTGNNLLPFNGDFERVCNGENQIDAFCGIQQDSMINANCECIGDPNDQLPFVTTWKTDNPGTSCSSCITIPTFTGEVYNYEVDWNNDGVYDEFLISGDVTHDFITIGTYTISIRGVFPRITFWNLDDKDKIININQWGDIKWSSMEHAFRGCANLNSDAIDSPDLSSVTALTSMFRKAIQFNGDISNWDVSSITSLAAMFVDAGSFNQPIGSWDVSNVTNMTSLFSDAASFNADLSTWDVTNVITMDNLFRDAVSFNQNIGNWNLNNATTLSEMLDDSGLSCENYSATLSGWAANSNTPNDLVLGAQGLEYNNSAISSRDQLIAKGWSIFGDTEGSCSISLACSTSSDSILCYDWLNQIISNTDFCIDPGSSAITYKVYTSEHNGAPAILVDENINCINPTAFGAGFTLYECDGTQIESCTYLGFETCSNPPTDNAIIGPSYDIAVLIYDSTIDVLPDCNANCTHPDYAALMNLYNTTNGDSWTNNDGWKEGSEGTDCDPCAWYGTGCDLNGRIDSIHLFSNGISGVLHKDIQELTFLRHLNLGLSNLSGEIPPEIGNLSNLELLWISNSDLEGEIPIEISNLINLTSLDLGSNELIGEISIEISNLINLTNLDIANNEFIGEIPIEFGNLINLTKLDLGGNELTGQIPVEIGNLSELIGLDLAVNNISGSIPPEIGNLSKLEDLNLFANQLIGEIPIEIGNLSNLEDIWIASNDLTGSIPDEIGNLLKLKRFWADQNNFSGEITSEFGKLLDLERLSLFDNNFTGEIPSELGNLPMLRQLLVHDNNLEGCFPPELQSLCSLTPNSTSIFTDAYNFTGNPLLPNSGDYELVCNGDPQIGAFCGQSQDSIINDLCECVPVNLQLPFVTTWKTDNDGTSCSSCITIPTTGSGYSYDVDWNNDGTYDEFGISGDVTYDFSTAGNYTIAIRGDFPRIYFNDEGDKRKIINIDQWGSIEWGNMSHAFHGCHNIQSNAIDSPDLNNVTDMSSMFRSTNNFNLNLSSWDVRNVTSMMGMFSGSTIFNGNLSSWDVSKVTDMSFMFNLTDNFNQDLSSWDVRNVTDMSYMFNATDNFDQDISSWDVSKVTDMSQMFFGADIFNQDISSWNVSKVMGMNRMFGLTNLFNQDLSSWDISNVSQMVGMFSNADSFNQSLGAWDINNGTLLAQFFDDSGTDCNNYTSTLIGWADNNNTPNGLILGAEGIQYGQSAIAARDELINNRGWTINGDTQGSCSNSQNPFLTTWKTDNDGTSCSSCITIPTTGSGYSYDVDWENDGIYDDFGINGDFTYDFSTAGTYTIAIRGAFPRIYFNDNGDKEKIINIDQWGDIEWTNMENAFWGCANVNSNAVDNPDLSMVTTMDNMFGSASEFNGNISGWDMSNITSTFRMFFEATSFNQPIGNWNMSNITDLNSMFLDASSFNQSIDSWDVSNVTNMLNVFRSATSFNQSIQNWDMSSVIRTSFMFGWATSFDQPLNNWNVSNVVFMNNMFENATSFNQPLDNWDVSNATLMSSLFSNATSFNQSLENWTVNNVVDMDFMFRSASAFNQNLGDWNISSVSELSNMLDNSGIDCTNYTSTLQGWAAKTNTPSGLEIGALNIEYGNEAKNARDSLINILNWTITGDIDSGMDCDECGPGSCLADNPPIWIDTQSMADITVSCVSDIPEPGALGYSNGQSADCLIEGDVAANRDESNFDGCSGDIIETWNYTTKCGDVITPFTRSITVSNQGNLVFDETPDPSITISCDDIDLYDISLDYSVDQGSNCISSGSVAPTILSNFDACGGTVTFTWSVNEPCYELLEFTQTANILANDNYQFSDLPKDFILDCDALPFTPDVLVISNGIEGACAASEQVIATTDPKTQDCPGTITNTWTFINPCTNTPITHVQNITLVECAPATTEEDNVEIRAGNIYNINLFDNDILPDSFSSRIIEIEREEIFFTSIFSDDGNFEFEIEESFFDTIRITYEICNLECDNCTIGTLKIVDEALKDIFLTDIITPDGDGMNDVLRFNFEFEIKGLKVIIFNRWGNKIYESINYENDWDASGFPGGIYYYVLKLGESEIKKTLTIVK